MTKPRKDRRIERSKQALREASLQVMLEKGYEAMTVSDIVERANVGRSTFYTHYADKEDLMQENLEGLRGYIEGHAPDLDDAGRSVHPALAFSLPMLRHVREQRQLFRSMVKPIQEQMHFMLTELVRQRLEGTEATRIGPSEVTAQFLVGAFLSVCVWWMNSGSDLSAEEVDRMFRKLAAPGLVP